MNAIVGNRAGASVYIVSGLLKRHAVSSPHAKLEDALAKASEFLADGCQDIAINDLERSRYTDNEIRLLLGLEKAEVSQQHHGEQSPASRVRLSLWSLLKPVGVNVGLHRQAG